MTTNNKGHRRRAYQRTGDFCFYCGAPKETTQMTLDHLVPRCLGGDKSPENVVPACRKCNIEKGGMTVEEYRAHLEAKRGAGTVVFSGERHGVIPASEAATTIQQYDS